MVASADGTWEHLPDMRMLPFTFRALEELELGPIWQAEFEERWPHYKTWFLREGEAARPSYATSVRMLRAHMPELVPAYERVVELAGGGGYRYASASLFGPGLNPWDRTRWSGGSGLPNVLPVASSMASTISKR